MKLVTKYTSVCLPDDMIRLVDAVIKPRGFSSRAEYIKHLIRQDIAKGVS